MKRGLSLYLSLVCLALAAGPLPAVVPSPEDSLLPVKSGGTLEKTFEGKVSEFAAKRFLTITTEGNGTRTFNLDEKNVAAVVDPGVAVGSRVRVIDARAADGERTVTVRIVESPAPLR